MAQASSSNYSYTERKRIRKSFGTRDSVLDVPYLLTMQQEISSQAKGEMDRSQREFFLRQQLKAIQEELGEADEKEEDEED